MEIVVSVVETPVDEFYPGRHGPGKVFVFSDNLMLESIDKKKVPGPEQARRAGTHSGLVTTLRATDAGKGDAFFPGDSLLFQIEATYRLNAVPATPPHALQSGQITVRGVILLTNWTPVGTRTFGITGGTGAYAYARGQVTQPDPPDDRLRVLEIVV
jgi:hypothetical protein